jgi:hypothetical protein
MIEGREKENIMPEKLGSIEFCMQMFMANIFMLYGMAESLEKSLSPDN